MTRTTILVSGLPASGKSVLARALASALSFPLLDKDDFLERIFVAKSTGDPAWRTALSRESDDLLQAAALAQSRAILVSFWHVAGMPADSGTPTAWLSNAAGQVINIHCVCAPTVAAHRFLARRRHPGHLDTSRKYTRLVTEFTGLAALGPPPFDQRIVVDTSSTFALSTLQDQIRIYLDAAEPAFSADEGALTASAAAPYV
jgi:hypothetical protein